MDENKIIKIKNYQIKSKEDDDIIEVIYGSYNEYHLIIYPSTYIIVVHKDIITPFGNFINQVNLEKKSQNDKILTLHDSVEKKELKKKMKNYIYDNVQIYLDTCKNIIDKKHYYLYFKYNSYDAKYALFNCDDFSQKIDMLKILKINETNDIKIYFEDDCYFTDLVTVDMKNQSDEKAKILYTTIDVKILESFCDYIIDEGHENAKFSQNYFTSDRYTNVTKYCTMYDTKKIFSAEICMEILNMFVPFDKDDDLPYMDEMSAFINFIRNQICILIENNAYLTHVKSLNDFYEAGQTNEEKQLIKKYISYILFVITQYDDEYIQASSKSHEKKEKLIPLITHIRSIYNIFKNNTIFELKLDDVNLSKSSFSLSASFRQMFSGGEESNITYLIIYTISIFTAAIIICCFYIFMTKKINDYNVDQHTLKIFD